MAHAVLKAIKLTNCSQTVFAKKIGTNLDMVNSWINRNIKVPLQYAFAIHYLTQGQVTWQEVCPHLAPFEKLWGGLQWIPQFLPLQMLEVPISQIEYEATTGREDSDDVNNIQNLAEHIKQFGLQHPIGIDIDKQLIFGRKRLLAYQLLSKETIKCWSISLSDLVADQYNPKVLCHYFRFSERLQVSLALQKFIGNRQGQRKNKLLRHESVEVKGRSDELIAKLLGFSSRFTYTHAKMVYGQASQALLDALDDERLDLLAALCFLPLSHSQQAQILNQSNQKISDFIQQAKPSNRSKSKMRKEEMSA